jgi:pyrroline-5-carboxylate reductase
VNSGVAATEKGQLLSCTHLTIAIDNMKLGFVGTGEITSAMVTGLSSCGIASHSIRLSPRNSAIAADLADRFAGVTVASSNQEVLDDCETAVIAVRPQVAQNVLSELRFRPDHKVISVVAALPSTAKRLSPTAIYPPDRLVEKLFATIGTVFAVETEEEFDAMCAATATIASYFAFTNAVASWLGQKKSQNRRLVNTSRECFWG